MQLSRVVLTIALAARSTNALPTCRPGEYHNTQERHRDSLEGAQLVNNEGSTRGFAESYMKTGAQSIDAGRNSSSNQQSQNGTTILSRSRDGPHMGSSGYRHGVGHHNAVNDVSRQTGANGVGHMRNEINPDHNAEEGKTGMMMEQRNHAVLDSKAARDTTEQTETATGSSHNKPSTIKAGFNLAARELFRAFRRGQDQRREQSRTEQQAHKEKNRQQPGVGHLINTRQDKAQMQTSSDEMMRADADETVDKRPSQATLSKPSDNVMSSEQGTISNMASNQTQENTHPATSQQQNAIHHREISHVPVPLYTPQTNRTPHPHMDTSGIKAGASQGGHYTLQTRNVRSSGLSPRKMVERLRAATGGTHQ